MLVGGDQVATTEVANSQRGLGSGEGQPTDPTNIRTALSADAIARALLENLHCRRATTPRLATRTDWYLALAYTVRDRMMDRFITTVESLLRQTNRSRALPICRPNS